MLILKVFLLTNKTHNFFNTLNKFNYYPFLRKIRGDFYICPLLPMILLSNNCCHLSYWIKVFSQLNIRLKHYLSLKTKKNDLVFKEIQKNLIMVILGNF